MKFGENSTEAMMALMVATLMIDGDYDEKEASLLAKTGKAVGMNQEDIVDLTKICLAAPAKIASEAALAITSKTNRDMAFMGMISMAGADGEIHENEAQLLHAIAKLWNINLDEVLA